MEQSGCGGSFSPDGTTLLMTMAFIAVVFLLLRATNKDDPKYAGNAKNLTYAVVGVLTLIGAIIVTSGVC